VARPVLRQRSRHFESKTGPARMGRRRLYAQVLVALDLSEGSRDCACCPAGPSLGTIIAMGA